MEKIKTFFQNLSIKKTFFLYVVAALFLALFLIAVTQNAAIDIFLGPSINFGQTVYEYQFILLQAIKNWCIPVYLALCMLLAAALFYRHKIARTVAALTEASQRIANNDLDFAVGYQSKDELGMVCAAFEKMRTALAENYSLLWRQAEHRKQLNAAFAHDLRTPLTVLKGYAEILRQGDDPKTRSTAEVMTRQLDRLERYTNSMSRLQKLEDALPDYQRTDQKRLVASLTQMAGLLCERAEKRLDFQSDITSAFLVLDEHLIEQVAENLLSNAIRYAKQNVVVHVAEKDGFLLLRVHDDGGGFSAEGLQNATQPYYSADADRSAHFGLGLTISKLLCEQHGGRLLLSNEADGALAQAKFQINHSI